MYSRIKCINDCRVSSLLRETPEIFYAGEVFGYKLKRRITGRDNTLFLVMSLQDLNHAENTTYDYQMSLKSFRENFEFDEGLSLPLSKYLFRVR